MSDIALADYLNGINTNDENRIPRINVDTDSVLEYYDPKEYALKLSSLQKWWIAIIITVLFFVLSSGISYDITGNIVHNLDFESYKVKTYGNSTFKVLIHTILFLLAVRLFLAWFF